MGIKNRYFSENVNAVEERPLREAWAELQDSPNCESKVAVFDGTNFHHSLIKDDQLWTKSLLVPRLKELSAAIELKLRGMVEACPGIELHVLFDGACAHTNSTLACKEATQSSRQAQILVRNAEAYVKLKHFGTSRTTGEAYGMDTGVFRRLLIDVLSKLGDRHRVAQVHCVDRDADVGTVLYALHHKACMVVSGDSDFFVLFSGVVLPPGSMRLAEEGHMFCKALWLSDRLRLLGIQEQEELLIAAFLAGSDFHPAVLQGASWNDIGRHVQREPRRGRSWQVIVRDLDPSAEKEYSKAYLENFDVESYELRNGASSSTLSWSSQGALAIGITSMLPKGATPDAVLELAAHSAPDHTGAVCDEDGCELGKHPVCQRRLVQGYLKGELSKSMFGFLCKRELYESPMLCDNIPGRPFARIVERSKARLAAWLAGPEPEAWDDEDAVRDERFLGLRITRLREDTLAECLKVWERLWTQILSDQEQHGWPDGRLAGALRDERESLTARVSVRGVQGTVSEALDAVDFDPSMWHGAVMAYAGRSAEQEPRAARTFWFLAVGQDIRTMPQQHAKLIQRCMAGAKCLEDQRRLFLLAVAQLGGDRVVTEHFKQLQHSLLPGRRDGFEAGLGLQFGGGEDAVAGAVLLGQLCWWLLSWLQDAYFLCGHDGLLLPSGVALALDGGVAFVPASCLPSASGADGYRISVRSACAPKGPWEATSSDVFAEVLKHVRALVEGEKREVKVIKQWLKLTHSSVAEAFKFHNQLLVVDGHPYRLQVQPLKKRVSEFQRFPMSHAEAGHSADSRILGPLLTCVEVAVVDFLVS
mmetsp:Transcript_95926/g.311047  ORF Transcript_95926/g.311047 Transcript_95926/m.311047 type:complete len:816 (+) Transcript_95926:105-2552(+)